MNDASRYGIGEAALHRSSANKSPKTHHRQVVAQAVKDGELINKREALREEYARLVEIRDIREPTTKESIIATAKGHEDNAATHAARRISDKKGWDWQSDKLNLGY